MKYVVAKNGNVNGTYNEAEEAVRVLYNLERNLNIKGYHIYKCDIIDGCVDLDNGVRIF